MAKRPPNRLVAGSVRPTITDRHPVPTVAGGDVRPGPPTELTRAAHRWRRWAAAAAVAFVALWGVWWPRAVERPLLRGPHGQSVLADADSDEQWRLVRRALDAGTVRLRRVDDDDAPWGRINEWTSPTTLVGTAALRVTAAVTGRPVAAVDPLVRVWLGPTMALVTVLGLAAFGWVAGGWVTAGCWAAAWPASAVVTGMTRCGSVNRQATTLGLFTFTVACVAAGRAVVARAPVDRRRAVLWGAGLGTLCGLGLWAAASELLPIWFLVAGLAAWDVGGGAVGDRRAVDGRGGPGGGVVAFWRAWAVAGGVVTAAALAFEFGPGSPPGGPGLFHRHLEFLSAWHVGLWVGFGAVVEAWRWRRAGRPRRWWDRLVLTLGPVAWAAATAVWFRRFDWDHLHVVQDSRFQSMVGLVVEFQPYAGGGAGATVHSAVTDFGLLPLVPLALVGLAAANRPVGWRWLLVAAAVMSTLTLYESRWAGQLLAVLVVLSGLAAAARWGRWRPLLAVGLTVAATVPIWAFEVPIARNIGALHGDPLQSPYLVQMALAAAAGDVAAAAAIPAGGPAGADRRPVVLTDWDWGGVLAGTGTVRVVGSPYWSNLDGFADTVTLFTETSPAAFDALLKRRGVDCLIVPDAETMTASVYTAFLARTGVPPTEEQVAATAIWHVAADPDRPVVPSPRLAELEPRWRIVRFRR